MAQRPPRKYACGGGDSHDLYGKLNYPTSKSDLDEGEIHKKQRIEDEEITLLKC